MKTGSYAFDINKPSYCSICERHYKNYKRFVIHMKKIHYPKSFISNLPITTPKLKRTEK